MSHNIVLLLREAYAEDLRRKPGEVDDVRLAEEFLEGFDFPRND